MFCFLSYLCVYDVYDVYMCIYSRLDIQMYRGKKRTDSMLPSVWESLVSSLLHLPGYLSQELLGILSLLLILPWDFWDYSHGLSSPDSSPHTYTSTLPAEPSSQPLTFILNATLNHCKFWFFFLRYPLITIMFMCVRVF